MSVIARPAAFRTTSCELRMLANVRSSASPFGGSEQITDMLNDRWALTCTLAPQALRGSGWLEAYIMSLRSGVNTTPLHHFARPHPIGTARGTTWISATAEQGASTINVSGVNPLDGTLEPGDMLGVDGLLLMVAASCAASGGVIDIPLVNRLRHKVWAGPAVTLARPEVQFRLVSPPGVVHANGAAQPVTLEFVEYIAPPAP